MMWTCNPQRPIDRYCPRVPIAPIENLRAEAYLEMANAQFHTALSEPLSPERLKGVELTPTISIWFTNVAVDESAMLGHFIWNLWRGAVIRTLDRRKPLSRVRILAPDSTSLRNSYAASEKPHLRQKRESTRRCWVSSTPRFSLGALVNEKSPDFGRSVLLRKRFIFSYLDVWRRVGDSNPR